MSEEADSSQLEAENRELVRKVASLEKQLKRLDKMAEANEVLHRTMIDELEATSQRLHERTLDLAFANTQLQIARASAEHANKVKSEFLANMSHELRTPLNAIIGYSEMLAEDLEEEGADDVVADLQKIRSAGKHLLSMINGILDISKIEAGKITLYLETFEVEPLVREVEAMLHPLVLEHNNTLVVRVDPGAGSIHADLTKVRQTLFNLLSNALKFTERGTVTLEAARRDADMIAFRVQDTGIGMTPDQLATIFDAFAQADPATARRYGGTGLGLTISQRFCRLMGGEITVTSEPGVGSVFVATIPVRVQEPQSAR